MSVMADHGFASPGSDFGETGITPDFQPPALIVRQMPMEQIEFMLGEQFDITADLIFREKIPSDIQMQAAPAVFRRIFQFQRRHIPDHTGNRYGTVNFRRQQLSQRLDRAAQAVAVFRIHQDIAAGYGNAVGLPAETVFIGLEITVLLQRDISRLGGRHDDRQRKSGCRTQIFREQHCRFFRLR